LHESKKAASHKEAVEHSERIGAQLLGFKNSKEMDLACKGCGKSRQMELKNLRATADDHGRCNRCAAIHRELTYATWRLRIL
jgi:hypothetical protein